MLRDFRLLPPTEPKDSAPNVNQSLREQLATILTLKSRDFKRFCLGAEGEKEIILLYCIYFSHHHLCPLLHLPTPSHHNHYTVVYVHEKEITLNFFLKEMVSYATVKFKPKTPFKNSGGCSKGNWERLVDLMTKQPGL